MEMRWRRSKGGRRGSISSGLICRSSLLVGFGVDCSARGCGWLAVGC